MAEVTRGGSITETKPMPKPPMMEQQAPSSPGPSSQGPSPKQSGPLAINVSPKKASTGSSAVPGAPKSKPQEIVTPLTSQEQEGLAIALVELSKMADSGAWHLGMDCDPDVPAGFAKNARGELEPQMGVAIFEMPLEEARIVVKMFVSMGKRNALIFKAARTLIEAHVNLQGGLILGSRFFEFGMRLFHQGLNFRGSKVAYAMELGKKAGASVVTK